MMLGIDWTALLFPWRKKPEPERNDPPPGYFEEKRRRMSEDYARIMTAYMNNTNQQAINAYAAAGLMNATPLQMMSMRTPTVAERLEAQMERQLKAVGYDVEDDLPNPPAA